MSDISARAPVHYPTMTQCPIKSAVPVSHEEATAAMARFGFSCDAAVRYRVPGFPGCILALHGAKELSVRLVDEMLARPEPSTVYSRGKTIAESADPPTAYYPPAPVEQPDATTSRFDERASELRAMLSWIEYQPCLRDGLAGEVVRSYLTAKIKELEDQRPVDGETGGNWRGN